VGRPLRASAVACRFDDTDCPANERVPLFNRHQAHDNAEDAMGLDDKMDNKSEELGGKVKEGVGKATDDERLEAEGKTDQTKSNLKQAGEDIKDTFKS
jgi:uncharacterized protein YjbJ (UPF0337 family)